MLKKRWIIVVENFTYEVEIKYKFFSGIRNISLNGKNVEYLTYKDSNDLNHYKFSIESHECTIKEQPISVIYTHDLFIDNSSIKTGLSITPSKEEVERYEWNKMKTAGKKKYILSQGLVNSIYYTCAGLIGIFFANWIDALWLNGEWNNISTNGVLRKGLLFLICGLLINSANSLYKWSKYKKRYTY